MRDASEPCAVQVDHKQVERVAALRLVVGSKNQLLSGRMKERSPVGLTQNGNLADIGAVDIGHIQLHVRWLHQSLFQ